MSEEMDWSKKLEDEYKKVQESIKKPNILLAGATGVGKSSLVNMIFGENLAVVGTGKPVTQKIDMFESDEIDVRLFDSKGYELGEAADQEFYESVVNLAKITNSPEKAIHLIWYCIDCGGNRVTDYDLQAIQTFAKAGIPVAIVLTKADLVSDKEVYDLRNALPPSTASYTFETTNNPEMQEYNQVEKLIAWSIDHLDESLRFAFIKSQKASLGEKWEKAHSLIMQHTITAFGIGFMPIPGSDAPGLVFNELALLGRILYLYDLGSISDALKSFGFGSIIGSLLTTGGKAAVGALLKLIPGVGTIVGGLISGAVGATITGAFGEATSAVSYKIAKISLDGNEEQAKEMIGQLGPLILEYAKRYISEGRKADDYTEENM